MGPRQKAYQNLGVALRAEFLWLFPLVVERNDGGASREGNGYFCPPDVRRGGVGSKDCTVEEWLAGSGPEILVHIMSGRHGTRREILIVQYSSRCSKQQGYYLESM